ncbi:hypothetical protein EVAR_7752_1 [Eumeta japonica]|uniref:Uncharacterized protein n=1 Tax=Eumeta variegata TaxID=151549 RepID=A0A4C1TLI7_EUMVA|nr:hypothetical protein EVAR_7752_1 [Eumeta japonica]
MKDASERFFAATENHLNSLLSSTVAYEDPPPHHLVHRTQMKITSPRRGQPTRTPPAPPGVPHPCRRPLVTFYAEVSTHKTHIGRPHKRQHLHADQATSNKYVKTFGLTARLYHTSGGF